MAANQNDGAFFLSSVSRQFRMPSHGVIFLVTESKKKAASVFVRFFFSRLDFEAVATGDMYMRLHVMSCFVLCSSNCRKTIYAQVA